MNRPESGSSTLKSYLLDELPEQQREEFERAYFANDEAFEELQIAETELIDDYVEGKLDEAEHRRFEQIYFSSGPKKQRVDFALSLHQYTAANTRKRTVRTGAGKWLKAAVVILAAASTLFFAEVLRLRNQISEIQNQNAALQKKSDELRKDSTKNSAQIESLKQQLEREKMQEDLNPPSPIATPIPQPTLIAFVLHPGLARDATGIQTLDLPARADFVRFELRMDRDPYQQYRVSLQTLGGDEIWSMSTLRPRTIRSGQAIIFDLPASRLERREYVILLQGKENAKYQDVSAYPFRTNIR